MTEWLHLREHFDRPAAENGLVRSFMAAEVSETTHSSVCGDRLGSLASSKYFAVGLVFCYGFSPLTWSGALREKSQNAW